MSDHVNQLEKENRKAQYNIKRVLQKAYLIAYSLNRSRPTAYIINDLRAISQRKPVTKTHSSVTQHPEILHLGEMICQSGETPHIVIKHYILTRKGKDYLFPHLYKAHIKKNEFQIELTQDQYNIYALERLIETKTSSGNFACATLSYFQYLYNALCNREISLYTALQKLLGLIYNCSGDGRYLAEKARDFICQLYLTRYFTEESNLRLMGQAFRESLLMINDVGYSKQRVQLIIDDLGNAQFALYAALFIIECSVDFVVEMLYLKLSSDISEFSIGIRQLLANAAWDKLESIGIGAKHAFVASLTQRGAADYLGAIGHGKG